MLYNGISTSAKQLTGGLITSVALANPAILYITLGNLLVNQANTFSEQINERQQFEEKRSLEIYETTRRRDRVITQTYNRR